MSDVLLSGEKSLRTRHVFYFREPTDYRSGDYKIHYLTRDRTRNPINVAKEPSLPQAPPLLFNLKEDPSENYNIAFSNPDLVARLTEEFEEAKSAIQNWERFQESRYGLEYSNLI
jgi:hypothetical protein